MYFYFVFSTKIIYIFYISSDCRLYPVLGRENSHCPVSCSQSNIDLRLCVGMSSTAFNIVPISTFSAQPLHGSHYFHLRIASSYFIKLLQWGQVSPAVFSKFGFSQKPSNLQETSSLAYIIQSSGKYTGSLLLHA